MDQLTRQDLSEATFEELLGMREKLGTKVYRHTVLELLKSSSSSAVDTRDPVAARNRLYGTSERGAPIEASSKKLDSRINFSRVHASDELVQKKKTRQFRDPRFDPQCGRFRPEKFEHNYAFLDECRREELQSLQKRWKKAKGETREKLAFLIQRLKNQLQAQQDKQQSHEVAKQMQSTTKKAFVNKSLLKRTRLVQHYQALKQAGRLDKYLQKKRKKLASKDRMHLYRE